MAPPFVAHTAASNLVPNENVIGGCGDNFHIQKVIYI